MRKPIKYEQLQPEDRMTVGADPNLSHRADSILSPGR